MLNYARAFWHRSVSQVMFMRSTLRYLNPVLLCCSVLTNTVFLLLFFYYVGQSWRICKIE